MVKTVRGKPKTKVTKSEIIGYLEVALGSAVAALTSYSILGGIVIGIGLSNVLKGAFEAVK